MRTAVALVICCGIATAVLTAADGLWTPLCVEVIWLVVLVKLWAVV